MPSKDFNLDDGRVVRIFKAKNNRNLRITISPSGQVRVSMPHWLPYRAGLEFVQKKREWIENNAKKPSLITDGQLVGKAHRVCVIGRSDKPASARITRTQIFIYLPLGTSINSELGQHTAKKAAIRALRQEATRLLPMRLRDLANRHGLTYKDVNIKQLKRRWGSCDQHKSITLSLYLMQLPWELIDYVLLHELSHTVVFGHGQDFWKQFESVLPDARKKQKALKQFSPLINT